MTNLATGTLSQHTIYYNIGTAPRSYELGKTNIGLANLSANFFCNTWLKYFLDQITFMVY